MDQPPSVANFLFAETGLDAGGNELLLDPILCVGEALRADAATFARDARALVEGGYRLTRVVPVDQFVWSPHVELVAWFERDR